MIYLRFSVKSKIQHYILKNKKKAIELINSLIYMLLELFILRLNARG